MSWKVYRKQRTVNKIPCIRIGTNNCFLNKAFCRANKLFNRGDYLTYDIACRVKSKNNKEEYGIKVHPNGNSSSKVTQSNQISISLKGYFASRGFKITENFTTRLNKFIPKDKSYCMWYFELNDDYIERIPLIKQQQSSIRRENTELKKQHNAANPVIEKPKSPEPPIKTNSKNQKDVNLQNEEHYDEMSIEEYFNDY